MTPLLYAIGNFISDAPWHFMAAVPFWGNERVKKSRVLLIITVLALSRAAAGYALLAYMPDGSVWVENYDFFHMCIWLAAFCACFKTHIVKLLYSIFLMTMLAISVDSVAYFIVNPFLPGRGILLIAEPIWIIVDMVVTATACWFVYRLSNGLLRQELSDLPTKSVLSLCLVPVIFFITVDIYIMTFGAFSNVLIAFFIVFSGLFLSYIHLRMIHNIRELLIRKSDMQILEMKNEYLLENYKTLESHFAQIAEMKHEIRHHLFAIRALHEDGENERLSKYLSDIQDNFVAIDEPVSCGNRLIQSVLGHAVRRARQMGFEIELDIALLPPLPISDADIVSLFMNLLDNALESCAKIEALERRWMKVKIKVRDPYLYVSVSNARGDMVKVDKNRYMSTKSKSYLDGNGIGVVRKIAEKYSGFSEFEHSEDTFIAETAIRID